MHNPPPARGLPAALLALLRPGTMLSPAVAMLAFELAAQARSGLSPGASPARLAAGSVAAALLAGASNAANQVWDIELDRTNRPERPLPAGELSPRQALRTAAALAVAALALAGGLGPATLAVFGGGALLSLAYSAPPLRLRNRLAGGIGAIALARGLLLPAAGWSVGGSLAHADPWILGGVLALYLVGATPAKDFADMPGDRAGGSASLPIALGPALAVRVMLPFYVLPFLGLAVLGRSGLLAAPPARVMAAGLGLALAGALLGAALLVRREALLERTRRGWVASYLLLGLAHLACAGVYLVP